MVPLQRNVPPPPPVPEAPLVAPLLGAVPVGEWGALGARGPDLCPPDSCRGHGGHRGRSGDAGRNQARPLGQEPHSGGFGILKNMG